MNKERKSPQPSRPEWDIVNAIPDAVAILDQKGRIVFVNAAWGRSSKATVLEGERYLDACRSAEEAFLPSVDAVATGLNAVLCGSIDCFACEYSIRHQAGSRHRYSLTINARPDEKGAVVSHSDLGAETIVPAPPKTLLQTLLSEAADAIFVCNNARKLVVANPTTSFWVGVDLSTCVGRKVSDFLPSELVPLMLSRYDETIERGESYTFEEVYLTVHGMRTFNITKGVYRSPSGRVQGVFTVARDITERKAMEREIIETSDKEKQRLGQELHENLCQYLVGISLLGNVLFEDLLRLKLRQAEDARQITTLVKDAITEVRALAKGLAPMPQEQEEGLIAALQELAAQARSIGKVRCSVRLPRSVQFLSPTTGIHLFRIAQEAVYNAIKHAQARRIQISLTAGRREVVLTVQDDGIGIQPDPPVNPEISSRLGLHIMNYRSRAIGAELLITSPEGGGTVVSCTLPRSRSGDVTGSTSSSL